MANHKSAQKRHRQNLKKQAHNRKARANLRTVVKRAVTLAETGNKDEALASAREATKLFDKAIVHGLVHKNNGQRSISRLNSRIHKLVNAKA